MLTPVGIAWFFTAILTCIPVWGSECTRALGLSDRPPLVEQSTDFTCGPATLLSWFKFQNIDGYIEESLSKTLKTNSEFGTSHVDFVEGIKTLGFEASFETDLSIKDLKKYLSHGYGIIISAQLENTGHWSLLTEVSADGTTLMLMDPWLAENGYRVVDSNKFYQDWYDYFGGPMEYHQRAAIVVNPKNETR